MRSLQSLTLIAAVVLGILSFVLAVALLLFPGFGPLLSPGFLGPLEYANRVRVAEVCLTVAGFSGTIAALMTAYQVISKAQRSPRLSISLRPVHTRLSRTGEGSYLLHLPFHHDEADGDITYVGLLDIAIHNNGDLPATQFAVLLTPQPVGESPEMDLSGPAALYMTDGDLALNLMQDESSDPAWKATAAGRSRGSLRIDAIGDLIPGDDCDLPTINVALVAPPHSSDTQQRYPRVVIRALASNARHSEVTLGVTPDPKTDYPDDATEV